MHKYVMVDFSRLPIELIHIILDYADIVVYRFGKYMNRLDKTDFRYKMLRNNKNPIWIGHNNYMIKHVISHHDEIKYLLYIQTHKTINNFHYLTVNKINKYDDGTLHTETQIEYIFDLQGKCNKIVNYLM